MKNWNQITDQRTLRKCFWEDHKTTCAKGRGRDGQYATDTRVAWVDWIDSLCRDGTISEALAQRATLEA